MPDDLKNQDEVAYGNGGDNGIGDEEQFLRDLGADVDLPEPVKRLDAGEREAQGKASHAFAELGRKNKAAAQLIRASKAEAEAMKKRLESLEKSRTETSSTTSMSSVAPMGSRQILQQLALQAMRNLGMTEIKTPEDQKLVDMEGQRLYAEEMNRLHETSRMAEKVPRMIEEQLSKYSLNDADKAEVRKRLSHVPLLQRAEDEVVRGEVAKYLGELQLSGESSDRTEGWQDGQPPRDARTVASSKVAASSVRSGRQDLGVKSGKSQSAPSPKPATDEEMEEMAKLKVTDVVAFREAKKRKVNYMGR